MNNINNRYSWDYASRYQADKYHASYYNDKDFNNDLNFNVVDNMTGKRYLYPIVIPGERLWGEKRYERKLHPDLMNSEFMDFAVKTSPDFSKYLKKEWDNPEEFMNEELMKFLIDEQPSNIARIPIPSLSKEIIYYALSKSLDAFKVLPISVKTDEICEYVINIDGKYLKNVPRNRKTTELCLKAVASYPAAIKYVPLGVLDHTFVERVNSLGIVIPDDCFGYVQECLVVHSKLQTDLSHDNITEQDDIKLDFVTSQIKLSELPGLFSYDAHNILVSIGINNIGELLNAATKQGFIASLGNSKNIINEILGAVKLLKCKYLNVDPLIEEDGSAISLELLCNKMGFTARTTNALTRSSYFEDSSGNKFFELMRSEDRENILCRIRNLGAKSKEEVITKAQIVIDYHDGHKLDFDSDDNNEESLETLLEEYKAAKSEVQSLNNRIDELLNKIQQKLYNESQNIVRGLHNE